MNEILNFFVSHWQLSILFVGLLLVYMGFEFMQNTGSSNEVSPEQAVEMYNHQQALFIDIRSIDDFNQGHIIGAMQISLHELDSKLKKLQKYMKKPVIVVCARGKSSLQGAKQLSAHGFEQAFSLAGGMLAWQAAGLPLITTTPALNKSEF